ncbi:immunoglobulin-binding protein 1 isoform X2 [Denticeps clupeoides]|uniref:immunoglobulin-binding protein 1 isoform X2 n=1 Tax=Denticeps clupeoides TaxID=299321 RepID=UPI0010A38AB8|nr:immunoglobulin-binding protein 1 isoform X2 [Denticeps clupeoides]
MASAEDASQMSYSEAPKLSDLLERGWKLFEEVETTNEPTGSNPIQVKVKRAMTALEDATRMVAQLDLFSRNEELEEISTADLKYLMLPALLGALTMKQVNPARRLELVQKGRVYFHDFLKRCKDYSISNFELPKPSEDSSGGPEEEGSGPALSFRQPDLITMATQRQAKIERYKQKKETESKLSEVKALVDSGQADDEATRDFYLLNIRKWIPISLDEIESIDQEIKILKSMDVLKQNAALPSEPRRPPMKPFILTKDAVQAKVFGAGYPSLATMTVDDWYEQHRKKGCLPDQGVPRRSDFDAEEREKEEKEKMEENDDAEALQKARDWDNWKDTHRRGYGNRQNMG